MVWDLLGSKQLAHIVVRNFDWMMQRKSSRFGIFKTKCASKKWKSLQGQVKPISERLYGRFCTVQVGKLNR